MTRKIIWLIRPDDGVAITHGRIQIEVSQVQTIIRDEDGDETVIIPDPQGARAAR